MGEISKIGKGFTPSTSNPSFWDGELYWLSIADMNQGKYIKQTSKKISLEGSKNKDPIEKGTLLMSFKLSLGKLGILTKDMYTNEAICNFKWKNNNISTEYMYYYLSSINIMKYGSQAAKGITLNNETLNTIPVILPNFDEQNKISNFLSKIDKKIELLEKKHQAYEDFKKYLMQQIFTQKLRFDFNEEWQEIQLKDIGTFYRGHSYNSTNVVEEGLLVLRSNNIKNNNLDFSLSELQFVNKDCKDHLALQKNDIVICMSNGTRKLVGKSAQYMGNYNNKLTVGAFCSIFRTKNKLAKYLFQTEHYKRNLYLILAGTNINNLKNSDLEKFKFNIPTNKMEINKIYNLFNALDKKIDFNKNKLDEILLFKKGLLQQMFV